MTVLNSRSQLDVAQTGFPPKIAAVLRWMPLVQESSTWFGSDLDRTCLCTAVCRHIKEQKRGELRVQNSFNAYPVSASSRNGCSSDITISSDLELLRGDEFEQHTEHFQVVNRPRRMT